MQYSFVQFRRRSQVALALLSAAIISLAIFASSVQAQTYTQLYNFPGGSKGLQPGDIVVTPDGSILGAAYYGTCACSLLFNYTGGKETVLDRFPEPAGYEAEFPQGLLLSQTGDTLYGTTMYGGSRSDACNPGCGIAFSYDLTTSKYKTLHEFQTGPKDGAAPVGTQVLDSAGDLYGVTFGGGTNYNGTFYEITAAGKEKVLYSFGAAPDGMYPGSGPVSYGGDYYGVTIEGGANTCDNGISCGTVFKITPSGKETVLYNFTGGSDGQNPYEIVGTYKGNMYGLSRNASNAVIAVFEINSAGDFSIAYNGSYVSQIAYIIMGTDGSLYASSSGGDDSSGAPTGFGQILKVTPTGGGSGTVTVLHEFDNTDGSMLNPFQNLVLHDGLLYGTTNYGGSSDNGVIYKLKP
jgi:uncharacterized repeat protein (TIGR03803 family)